MASIHPIGVADTTDTVADLGAATMAVAVLTPVVLAATMGAVVVVFKAVAGVATALAAALVAAVLTAAAVAIVSLVIRTTASAKTGKCGFRKCISPFAESSSFHSLLFSICLFPIENSCFHVGIERAQLLTLYKICVKK
jgi:hypothetical protein